MRSLNRKLIFGAILLFQENSKYLDWRVKFQTVRTLPALESCDPSAGLSKIG